MLYKQQNILDTDYFKNETKNNNNKETDELKRCVICDSTDHYDTFKALGLPSNPIMYWSIDPTTKEHRCNRCQESILSNQQELELLDYDELMQSSDSEELIMIDEDEFITSEEDLINYLKEIGGIKETYDTFDEEQLETKPSTLSLR